MDPWSALLALYGAAAQLASMVRQRKTKPQNLGDHPSRRRMIRFVETHPGAQLTDICEDLEINRGTATHHMRLLEDSGIVEGLVGANRHHFFPPGMADETKRRMALLRAGRVLEVATTIIDKPGIIQKDINDVVPLSPTTLRAYLAELEAEGLITVNQQWRSHHYFPTEQLEELVDRLEP